MNRSSNSEIYSPRSVITMVGLFFVLFWLLYSIASFLHESRKVQAEIEDIHATNKTLQAEITEKQQQLAYLRTPERLEKEAKMQMGKKLPGEQVIVLVEEKLEILPTEAARAEVEKIKSEPNWKKWQYLFFN
jgi:cell division protein FtsL